MQLTSKSILIALALAYGGTAVSAVPAGESSVAARSAEYEDLNAREIDDMELYVRDPFSLFGFGTPTRAHGETDNSHTGAVLSKKTSVGETSPEASDLHETEHVLPKSKGKKLKNKGRGPRYNPKPTMDVASRRRFRKVAGQDSALLNEAANDKTHAYHSTAIHMKQEAAVRKNPKLLKEALKKSTHPLHGAAQTVKAQNSRRKATLRGALKDESHPLHEAAVAHRNKQQDKAIKNAQSTNPKLVEAALANKNHKLHKAAQRVAAQDNVAGFDALPSGF
jgi:hypothetical protein